MEGAACRGYTACSITGRRKGWGACCTLGPQSHDTFAQVSTGLHRRQPKYLVKTPLRKGVKRVRL